MRYLVTGAAGFIGSHLVDRLLGEGHELLGLDNFQTGVESNLEGARKNKGFNFIESNVIDLSDQEQSLGPLDGIFHLASPASPKDFTEIPVEIAVTNSLGTLRVLECAQKRGIRVLLASTSEVYGEPQSHPQKEEDLGLVSSVGIRSAYDEGKRFGEALAMAFYRSRQLDVRLARIFNTYGPRLRLEDGRVLSNFFSQALSGKPLTLYGGGTHTRSFCFVDDLVGGLVSLFDLKNPKERIYNLGNNQEISVAELAEKISEIVGVPHKITDQPLPHKDDPTRRCPDLSKASRDLGYSPKVSLEQGLAICLPWYRDVLEQVKSKK